MVEYVKSIIEVFGNNRAVVVGERLVLGNLFANLVVRNLRHFVPYSANPCG